MVLELMVDRVDLVDEGANSAAFIELYKRKEPTEMTVEEILEEMKPEYADVLKTKIAEADTAAKELIKSKGEVTTLTGTLESTIQELTKAKEKLPCECDGEADEKGVCKVCGKPKLQKAGSSQFDETETLKSIPEEARKYINTIKAQKEAAEESLRKSKEAEIESIAKAKAAELKSLPIEQDTLVNVLKTASKEVVDVLAAAAAAIDKTVLDELGKGANGQKAKEQDANSAWAKIESEAEKVMKSATEKITKAKAIAQVIDAQPSLYKEYLNGGAE